MDDREELTRRIFDLEIEAAALRLNLSTTEHISRRRWEILQDRRDEIARLREQLRRNELHLQRRTAALVRLIARKEAAMPCSCSDDNLPGMWSHSDFMGGDPDDRSYAERGEGWSR